MTSAGRPIRVLIAGAGVAALEAALALRELAGARVQVTIVAPETEFVYRPLRVREPFAARAAPRYSLEAIAADIGAELKHDALRSVDPESRVVHTEAGEALDYDALLLALGARPRPRFKHALTLDPAQLDAQLHGLIQDLEDGYIHTFAFLAPSKMSWPLPLYELALLTARSALQSNQPATITIVTPETAPLEVFGAAASEAVGALLAERGITHIASSGCKVPAPGQVSIEPGHQHIQADRVIALPELVGPSTPGVPKHNRYGFIPVDSHCRVLGLERVFAAGDATEFPVKHGGVAAQHADAAAISIAALAGAPVRPEPFHPTIRGILLNGEQPLYLSAELSGGRGLNSHVSATATWEPATKIAASYLAPYLQTRAEEAGNSVSWAEEDAHGSDWIDAGWNSH